MTRTTLFAATVMMSLAMSNAEEKFNDVSLLRSASSSISICALVQKDDPSSLFVVVGIPRTNPIAKETLVVQLGSFKEDGVDIKGSEYLKLVRNSGIFGKDTLDLSIKITLFESNESNEKDGEIEDPFGELVDDGFAISKSGEYFVAFSYIGEDRYMYIAALRFGVIDRRDYRDTSLADGVYILGSLSPVQVGFLSQLHE